MLITDYDNKKKETKFINLKSVQSFIEVKWDFKRWLDPDRAEIRWYWEMIVCWVLHDTDIGAVI